MTVAVDKGKLLDQAQKYIQKGQLDKAISEYQKVVEADPRDLRTRLKLGELYLKVGNKASALTEYTRAGESYASDGFNLQAIAVFKQLLKIDPSVSDIYVKLADLYRKQGLIADAISQYRIVITNYEKQGKVTEAIDALKQMASLDPENFSIRVKLAEIYLKNGHRKESLEEYSKIADDLEKKGRSDDAVVLYQRLIATDPTYTKALTNLGEAYLKVGKIDDALSEFKSAIEKDPNDKKALFLLAETYQKLNKTEDAKKSYEKLLQIEPSSIEAGKGLSSLLLKEGNHEAAIMAALPAIDTAIERGSHDSALSILLEFYRNEIREPHLLEKMAELYRLKGETNKEMAVREEIAHIKGETPGVEEAKEKTEAEPEILEEIEEAKEEVNIVEPPVEEHFVLREEPKEAPAEDIHRYLTEAEVYIKYGLTDKAVDILTAAHKAFPKDLEVRNKLASLGVTLPGEVEEVLPEIEEISLEPETHEEVALPEAEELPEHEVAGEPSVEMPSEAPLEAEAYPLSKIREDMEEADFYIQQGLYEDARGICNRILEHSPENEEAQLKLKAIDDAAGGMVAAPEPPAKESAVESFFDLAAELDTEEFETLTSPPGMREAEKFGFEDIFSEFKKGVETQLEKEDTETHYNLGIAYKEMGLLDDAIREFKIASSDPKIEFDCYNLIGICYVEKGAPQKAVEVFKKSLSLPGRSQDEYASMSYELGRAYELSGMPTEALSSYMEAGKKTPGFRDVDSRISKLGGGRETKKGRVSFV